MNPLRVIVVGASMGGLNALETILSGLTAEFPLPIAIVQHRSKSPRDMLAVLLQDHTSLTVREAEDKDPLKPAHVYLAPADYHLLLEPGQCTLSLEPPVNYARPSIDVLFESAAESYGEGVMAVVLTGNSADGARGAARVKAMGGIVLVQDPHHSESSKMPMAAIASSKIDYILKLEEIASIMIDSCRLREGNKNGER